MMALFELNPEILWQLGNAARELSGPSATPTAERGAQFASRVLPLAPRCHEKCGVSLPHLS